MVEAAGGGGGGDITGIGEIPFGSDVRAAANEMVRAVGKVRDRAIEMRGDWQKLGGMYEAPEQHLVLVAMNKPRDAAQDAHDKAGKADSALTVFADECDRLNARKLKLQGEMLCVASAIAAEENKPLDSSDFYAKTGTRKPSPELQALHGDEAANEREKQSIMVDYWAAQRACITALNALWGGPPAKAVDDTGAPSNSVRVGFTADGLQEAIRTGAVPWDAPESWRRDPSRVALGAWDTTKDTLTAFATLVGINGTDAAIEAWTTMGTQARDLALLASPALAAAYPAEAAAARKRMGDALKAFGTMAERDPGYTLGTLIPMLLGTKGTTAGLKGLKGIDKKTDGAASLFAFANSGSRHSLTDLAEISDTLDRTTDPIDDLKTTPAPNLDQPESESGAPVPGGDRVAAAETPRTEVTAPAPGSADGTPAAPTPGQGKQLWDPETSPRFTVNQADAPSKRYSDQDVQDALDRAPVNEHGEPVDHRTGHPLTPEKAGGGRGWEMKWDPTEGEWVAQNPGNGYPTDLPPKGEPNSYGYDANGDRMEYANHRPKLTLDFARDVWRRQAGIPDHIQPGTPEWNKYSVKVLDIHGDSRTIRWDGVSKRNGPDGWDLGHIDDEYWEKHKSYLNHELSKEDFIAWHKDPNRYQVEDGPRNRSGKDHQRT